MKLVRHLTCSPKGGSIATILHLPVLADDSGLMVDELGGRPEFILHASLVIITMPATTRSCSMN